MEIQPYANFSVKNLKFGDNSKKPEPASDRKKSASGDKVEISSESLDKLRLMEIKKRISSGYYNSRMVGEDLSEKLTKVIDPLTG